MVRTMIPLTQEDKEQSGNLPLINTLRSYNFSTEKKANEGGNPPSFYDDDLQKWSKKFAKSIKDRHEFK